MIYNILGASETNLVKFNYFNSRPIAPKIQVPFAFPSWTITIAAL
jgi:hypothetical protein